MINMKQKGAVKGRKGDAITLPLEFFHHHLGRLVDSRKLHQKAQPTFVVPVAPQQNLQEGEDAKPVWQQFLEEPLDDDIARIHQDLGGQM